MSLKFGWPWSDNWWICKDKAYFFNTDINALFEVDRNRQQLKIIDNLCVKGTGRRSHSECIVKGNKVYCLPMLGSDIWVYDLHKKVWEIIYLDSDLKACYMVNPWVIDDCIYAFMLFRREIFVLDCLSNQVSIIPICCGDDKLGFDRAVIDDKAYFVSNKECIVYEVDLRNKETKIIHSGYKVEGLRTISFDGNNFWLTGFDKKIFSMEVNSLKVKIWNDFSKDFGVYDFISTSNLSETDLIKNNFERNGVELFFRSHYVGGKIWLIPYVSNRIVVVDPVKDKVTELDIPEENENIKSIRLRTMMQKYLCLYVRDDRFIGLYSLKNQSLIEIDSKNETHEMYYPIHLDIRNYEMEGVLTEVDSFQKRLFEKFVFEDIG